MSSKHGARPVALAVTLAACAGSGTRGVAQAPVTSTVTRDPASLPTDPSVLHGTLENGFTYYVRRAALPSKGAYLGLVVKAGSANEGEGQQGFAHFVQHLAFSGTARYEREKPAEFLSRLGQAPAPDQHVATSVDCSAYALELPPNSGDALSTALDLLANWSSAIAFAPAEVERERQSVLAEMHSGSPEQQLARQTFDALLGGTTSPTVHSASENAVANATPAQLLGFYRAFYRPERMALVAVGEFEPKVLERTIRERFAGLKAFGPASPAAASVAPPSRDTSFAFLPAPEPEEDGDDDEPEDKAPPIPSIISIAFEQSRSAIRTRADVRRALIETAYGALVASRLQKLVRQPDSTLTTARWLSVPELPVELSVAQAAVKRGRLEGGMQALWAELHGIELGGFTEPEFAFAIQRLKASSAAANGEQAQDGMSATRSMAAHFLYGDALVAEQTRHVLEQELIDELSLSELNDFARTLWKSAAKRVLVSGPKAQLRPEQTLRAAMARAEGAEPGAPSADGDADVLVDALPTPGSVVHEEALGELAATVWTLSNGATVVLKPTRFKAGEVLLQARAAGGTSLASDRDYWSASLAPQIVSAGGLGRFEPKELGKLLEGRSVEGHPWVSETEQGISARAAPEDLKLMLELVYLGFTAPRGDAEAFDEFKASYREQLRARDADPKQAFAEILRQQSYGNHLRRRAATQKSVEQLRLDAALQFYRQRFAHASDFTFVLVGDLDPERTRPLVERYLASLPDAGPRGQRSQWRDVGARVAGGVKRINVELGSGDRSSLYFDFHRALPWSRAAETELAALRGYVEVRLREALAQEPLAVHSLSVAAEFEQRPVAQSSLTISFDTARSLMDESERKVLGLVQELTDSPPRPSDVTAVRDARKRYLERAFATNVFWLTELSEDYAFSSEPREIQELAADAERIDAELIERAARTYLDSSGYVEAIRSPVRK
jgi:zinc protease